MIDHLEGIDLEDSWILRWEFDRDTKRLVIDLEASLWPGNPHYEEPKTGDYTCYKQERMIFSGVRTVKGLPLQAEVEENRDDDGSADYGNIYGFEQTDDETFRFETDFAEVYVESASFDLAVQEAV